jgi:glycosyltransferase involved in cell wall biosynthesis
VVITFVTVSPNKPVGGVTSIYQFANAMRRRGHDVHLVHRRWRGDRIEGPDKVTWCPLEEGIRHHFPLPFDPTKLPDADFVFFFDERIPPRCGLRLMFVQGLRVREKHQARMRSPCPKICVARWLVEVGREAGVPEEQLVYVPYGLDHQKYRVLTPIKDRPPRVAMLYHLHPVKGAEYGLEALARVKERNPGLEAVAFGTMDPAHLIPPWMRFLKSPPQSVLVGEIYNGSRVFVSPSIHEGFGFTAVEAMACGCALVTAANGGSDDYAHEGETALVVEPRDPGALADRIERLLVDDAERVRLATQGNEYVKRFDWDETSRVIESFLEKYAADPERYTRPALEVQ